MLLEVKLTESKFQRIVAVPDEPALFEIDNKWLAETIVSMLEDVGGVARAVNVLEAWVRLVPERLLVVLVVASAGLPKSSTF